MYDRLLKMPVTLHLRSPGAEDEHGNPVDTETNVVTVGHVALQRPVEEDSTVGEQFRLFLKAGEILSGWDAVTAGGFKYEVIGQPWEVFNPRTGVVHHIEADIRRAST